MPRLSDLGSIGMGAGGHQGSIDKVPIANGMGPFWLNSNEIVYPTYSNTIESKNPFNGSAPITVAPRGCNDLRANGHVWAAWLAGYGLFASTGFYSNIAGLQAVGPNGEIAYTPDRQAGIGVDVIETDGTIWRLSDGVVYDLQLLNARTAIWTFNQVVFTKGIPVPQVLPGGVWGPKIAYVGLESYICYFSGSAGVVIHKTTDASMGWVFAGPGINAFNHDMKTISGNTLKVVASSGAGELPNEIMEAYFIPGVTPMVPLIKQDHVVPINKPCWMGWFEFTNNPNPIAPHNCLLWVPTGGDIIYYAPTMPIQIAQWIQGNTVDSINEQVENCPFPAVAYWDSRNWPFLPNLRPGDWIALQAYCKSFESPSVFEDNMRFIINGIPSNYDKICLVCQCYTSNDSLTKNLDALVPVFARLARDFERVNMLLVFSDQGRATGLNDHPELRPLYQQLFNGIHGVPLMPDTQLPLEVWDVIIRMHEEFAQECIDAHPDDMEKAARMWTERVNEQVLFSFPDQGYCWKSADSNRPPSKDSQARQLDGAFFGWDLLLASSVNGPKNLVDYPPGVNDLTGQHPIHPGDPLAPEFNPYNWLEEDPMGMHVLILDYDSVVGRSNPNGMLVRFEIASDHPVVQVELDLVEDEEPSIVINFLDEPRRDGRYVRALAFKPVREGVWTLSVKALDNQGNQAETTGIYKVTVIP